MSKQRPAVRLLTIVGLLLVPIVLLGYLFFDNTNREIAFAQKERDGVALLKVIVPVVAKLSTDGAELTSNEIDAIEKAGGKFGGPLQVSDQLTSFLVEIKRGEKDDAFALKLARDQIVRIGDMSNPILDPNLDSYYMM